MTDRMRPIPFDKMVNWVIQEYREHRTIYGIPEAKFYRKKTEDTIEMFGEKIATPIGVAAGPNSQLTQNIVAAYLSGARFIELKTVQTLDGEDLVVSKPCINAYDECYNVEWSTELKVSEALDEYVKAYLLLHILMKEHNLSKERDFIFNMSVGYDLVGIKSVKIDSFIEGLKDAKDSTIWGHCVDYLRKNIGLFEHFTLADLESIDTKICTSITLSTLHGCPPIEIERIASYLLEEKGLNTFIKLNPTLLGEKKVTDIFKRMGYDYIVLNPHHFIHDLQYQDGIAMLKRLKNLARTLNLTLGVKLTNTLPVKITNKELPGEEMYMSGRSLYPLTINLASLLAWEFNGDLCISFSGGADYFNIDKIIDTGIRPVTFATTILKPGGYLRIKKMAELLEDKIYSVSKVNTGDLIKLSTNSINDKHHLKNSRKVASRKLKTELPLFDCSIAPCSIGCPINQQIPAYLSHIASNNYDEAFKVIINDNSAPFTTGTICEHNCMTKCTRIDYDESLSIRELKMLAAEKAYDKYIRNVTPKPLLTKSKACVIGAGPAGLSVAYFLRRNGMDVTVLEKREKPFGVVQYVIPEFRIKNDAINNDFELVKSSGVNFNFGVESFNVNDLKKQFDYVILAIGAWGKTTPPFKKGSEYTINAVQFLEDFKSGKEKLKLGKHVTIIGAGNVAMDAARAALKVKGVQDVTIIYRRTREKMRAIFEEIESALKEGVSIRELLLPVEYNKEVLICEKMVIDNNGEIKGTASFEKIISDSVIVAIGEKVESILLDLNGIKLDGKSLPMVNETLETNIDNVYVAGDVRTGPRTIVEAIADGKKVAQNILMKEHLTPDFVKYPNVASIDQILSKKGILCDKSAGNNEANRCLSCENICELCVDVCPNRANMVIEVNNSRQVIHIDGMCNECGNCAVFCPHIGAPYKDKFTVFWTKEDFLSSTNCGIYVENIETFEYLIRTETKEVVNTADGYINEVIEVILKDYNYIL